MRIGQSEVFKNTGIRLGHENSPFKGAKISFSNPEQKKDSLTIGGGEKNSLMESLTQQRENITKQKYDLIGRTIEKGGSMESIREQLDLYDEQLKTVNMQMKQALMSQQENKDSKKINNEPKTEEEVQNERLSNLVENSGSLEQAKVVTSVKDRVEGELNVAKSEVQLDGEHVTEGKQNKVADLEAKLQSLNESQAAQILDAHEQVSKNAEETAQSAKGTTEKKEKSSDEIGSQEETVVETVSSENKKEENFS